MFIRGTGHRILITEGTWLFDPRRQAKQSLWRSFGM